MSEHKFKPGDVCEYDGTPLPVTKRGEGDACPVCEEDLTQVVDWEDHKRKRGARDD